MTTPMRSDLAARAMADAKGLSPPIDDFMAPEALPGYTIERLVARGGQGVVFEGVHLATGRRVAIKMLRDASFGEGREKDRFDREMALVNRVEHPGVVPVRDCIRTADRIWHVMDFIDGVPLDVWARQRQPTLEKVLEVISATADTVAAAHVRGIIHRDLKPSNVLIDEFDHPHVLDFGLAKSIDDSLSGARDLTQSGQFVGSLPWASPEQADGRSRDVDTRTDVYALGVMLHQVLAGDFPYPLDGPIRVALDRICHAEPIPLRRVRRDIDIDVETIVLTCLRKAPSRRYQSAAELANELRRRLDGAPIAARGDSVLYLLGKAVQRHRVLVTMATSIAIILTGAVAALVVLYRERDRQAAMAGEISQFFVEELIGNVDPMRGVGREARVIDVVDDATVALEGRFSDPRVDAFLRRSIGSAYRELGEEDRAEPLLERAVAELEPLLPPEHPERLQAISALAQLRLDQGRAADAEALLRPLVSATVQQPALLGLRENLAAALAAQERWDESLALFEEVRRAREASHGRDEAAVLNTLGNIASVHQNRHAFAEAEPLYRTVLAGTTRVHGAEHVRTSVAQANLAACLMSQGRLDEAAPLLEAATTIRRAQLGDAHERTLDAIVLRAELEQQANHPQSALALLSEVLERRTAAGRGNDSVSLGITRRIAMSHLALGQPEAAVEPLGRALERLRATIGPDQVETLETQRQLARALRLVGRVVDAEALLVDALERVTRVQGEGAPMTLLTLTGLALTRAERGESAAALALLDQAIERGTSRDGPDSPAVILAVESAWGVADRGGIDDARLRYAAMMVAAHERGAPTASLIVEVWRERAIDGRSSGSPAEAP